MRRPPAPQYARRCPHCKRDAPEPLHNDCPTLLAENEKRTSEEKLLWRLFGIGKGASR